MIEIADVFRRFAADYVSAYGASFPSANPARAISSIIRARSGDMVVSLP
jgi:hypothetical protein